MKKAIMTALLLCVAFLAPQAQEQFDYKLVKEIIDNERTYYNDILKLYLAAMLNEQAALVVRLVLRKLLVLLEGVISEYDLCRVLYPKDSLFCLLKVVSLNN